MKKLIIAIIAMLTFIPSMAFAASVNNATITGDFQIYYNGHMEHFADGAGKTARPIVLNGITYLPVRAVAGLVGLTSEWNATTKTVELTSGGEVVENRYGYVLEEPKQITVDTGQNITITLDGKVQNVPAPFIYNGTTYLPVRAICDMVGIPVEWRADTRTILLGTYPHEASPSAIIPAATKVLTDKDMIDLGHKYKDGSFFIESDAGVCPDIQLDFKNEGYKTVTFTVSTDDVYDKANQDVAVVGRDVVNVKGTTLGNVPQAYGQTKTYSADISGYKVGEIQVGFALNANAVVSNIYLTK